MDYGLAIGMDRIQALVQRLGEGLRTRLGELPAVTVHDKGSRRCGIVSFQHARIDATTTRDRLRAKGINVSVTTQASTRLDFE